MPHPKRIPTGPKTTKTEFQRYLDDHEDAVGFLYRRLREYRKHIKLRTTFGLWLRSRYLADFDKAYVSFWLAKPELYGKIYEELQAKRINDEQPIHL